ncbi:hypothetical protein NZD89_27140 [Alicyclobacillus fastidiosus]|uniref:Uncharacterized protein n=1 Tax=Alicyclobacillus fastidiosus TaxID=392011 RepID=A0ABY6ZFZ3_9BACL|nr:hypothetical protein [Alicyclobacillus fastidiosus]WAH41835.1 hypothetical protein NZD89_27140 [Alicyclobacillus fastidiosus]GMA63536.1 hypothetical protein GCM10025859_39760 [Alicyclobacillus fastidiosus]
MTSWIWLTSLLSLAGVVFLAISGRGTPTRVSYTLSMWLYAVSAVAALLGFVGVLLNHGQAETYLFSMFGLQEHEGFRVGIATTLVTLLLYLVATVWMFVQWRRADRANTARAHDESLVGAWATFGLSILILAPTLAQAFLGMVLTVLSTFYLFCRLPLGEGVRALEVRVVIIVTLVISTILQTLPTWVAWHALHTVQLTEIQYQVVGSGWHGPGWLVWVWLLGVVVEAATWFVLPTLLKASPLGVQLRLIIVQGLASALYVWLAWSVVVASLWHVWLVIVAGLVALGAFAGTLKRIQVRGL